MLSLFLKSLFAIIIIELTIIHALPTYTVHWKCSIQQANTSSASSNQTVQPRQHAAPSSDRIKSLPEFKGSLPELYSGYLEANSDKSLFYTYAPAVVDSETFIVWLQGGPGCAGTLGFFSENGPIEISQSSPSPSLNPESWTNFANMLWLDQPFGTGYSQGQAAYTTTIEEASSDFVNALKSFYQKFPHLMKKKLYLVGESYGSIWSANFAEALLSEPSLNINFMGVGIVSGLTADYETQEQITASIWVEHISKLGYYFNNTSSTISEEFKKRNKECQYDSVLNRLTFPTEQYPIWRPEYNFSTSTSLRKREALDGEDIGNVFNSISGCDLYSLSNFLLYLENSCVITYDVSLDCSFNEYNDPLITYLNREDVRSSLHATKASTALTSGEGVFADGCNFDLYKKIVSNNVESVLVEIIPRLTEKYKVSFLAGALDLQILWTGTLLALQNTTWNGWQGFTQSPGSLETTNGFTLDERNLAFTLSNSVGHMAPSKDPQMVREWLENTLLY
ncbi:serine carboxypeptidase Sxa2 [Schizosaccharomyces pombe]|uniref:Carboxypeptidase sxa2 n=1 Tax=Schizosaccharomyces pombe (strain 972 / ATCC 24843) TaxID=284812 RepID=SXA2_SCHPO|nr:serine carboxypeptidase Sxa2 [Schizosaccharomyces pombe]P32825.1 RecName: Full=Carboxypeptidase sxa2; Flags: Precursor [Schizosaccharomyces pombe 972h-]BAA01047.1 put. serine carboxypeptidase [Schizosaccharomyces pombe]CAB36509.1 serine carboxypeptidase Sxa2 [Schizosaccharomyces pombe]|eukprot:NP_593043.1 serine carboxypeptidase Sxa2 [Schizosaccharomyces pombe]